MDFSSVKRVFAVHPEYAGADPASSKQFWTGYVRNFESSLNGKITLVNGCSSLLACGFNQFWATALKLQQKGMPITHFAMLHADIVPDTGWLEILMEDLLTSGADLVGAVVPIKDPLGLTSTAIDDPKDPFNVTRRLTMNEVYKLPEVFSATDCGYEEGRLLLNTGCWVCDFTKPWRLQSEIDSDTGKEVLKLRFTIRDQIRVHRSKVKNDSGIEVDKVDYIPVVDPEDWNFSRQLQKLGAKVRATRRVGLDHKGGLPFSSREPWGEWEWDRVFQHKFESKPIQGSFEHLDIPGWLTTEEGEALAGLAKDRFALEIGSYCGRSTVWIARSALHVDAVDTFDGRAIDADGEGLKTLADFTFNMERYGVGSRVTAHKGTSEDVVPKLAKRIQFAFIDGAHDYESVRKDIDLCLGVMDVGGIIAFHDYNNENGVKKAVNELCSISQVLGIRGSVAALRLLPSTKDNRFSGRNGHIQFSKSQPQEATT